MAQPYCLAMVLCDEVYKDPATNKHFILGTFSNFSAKTYPVRVRMCVYFVVTDGLGQVTLRLQLVDAKTGTVDATHGGDVEGRVFLIGMDVDLESPLMLLESVLKIEADLPAPGLYHCELWANDEVLMTRRFSATKIETRNPE